MFRSAAQIFDFLRVQEHFEVDAEEATITIRKREGPKERLLALCLREVAVP